MTPSATSAAIDHGRAGPDVEGAHRCGRQPRHAPDHRVVTFGADVGAHAPELVDVEEAALEHVLGRDAGALRRRQHRHQDRLEVGRHARVGQGHEVDRPRPRPGWRTRSPSGRCVDDGARVGELLQEQVEVIGAGVLQRDVAAGRDRRGGPGAGLDAVRDRDVLGRRRARRPRRSRSCWCPAPSIRAPIATRNAAMSAISGSRAALSITVVPRARTAAIIRFSVAPTLG